ncbi:MAG TPA: FUN14 domain-containing protein [Nitrososphaeraceae archaeon]|nr:FUN14 domain-containing protein [Nitrososphaeraceae archaeon]
MIIETLIQIATSVGGGFLIGILLGYFVKKLLKILLFVAGGIVGLLIFLQQQEIISVNQERLEGSSTFILTTLSSSFDKITQSEDISSLGIPLIASMTVGFTLALVKG